MEMFENCKLAVKKMFEALSLNIYTAPKAAFMVN